MRAVTVVLPPRVVSVSDFTGPTAAANHVLTSTVMLPPPKGTVIVTLTIVAW